MDVDKRKFGTCIVRQCLLVVLISSFVACVKFGLISPIEVVEEWGCQDSEIRLTCSNFDSTIAILEATFKPNCSLKARNSSYAGDNDTENCVQLDLRRLTPKPVPRLDETIAARRLLEALRQSHKKDDESVDPTVKPIKVASFDFGLTPRDDVDDLKRKRLALRASLESLLVDYLRGLAPDNNGLTDDSHGERVKRSNRAEISLQKNDDQNKSSENSDAENVKNLNVRNENLLIRNNNSENAYDNDEIDDQSNRTPNASRSFCPERNQRITQLDRNELATAIENISELKHNIRSLLNHRCSGKNHCSFVFSEDHPFSVLWPYGVVHIKYICMERYRLNKFCGEHLVVVNESPEPDPEIGDSPQLRSLPNENEIERIPSGLQEENGVKREGPIAEALIQNEQMFHHLKILKPSPSEMENQRRKSAAEPQQIDKTRKGVYSQDFRVMKVLPSNLDDFNDIEKIADEFYFKKRRRGYRAYR